MNTLKSNLDFEKEQSQGPGGPIPHGQADATFLHQTDSNRATPVADGKGFVWVSGPRWSRGAEPQASLDMHTRLVGAGWWSQTWCHPCTCRPHRSRSRHATCGGFNVRLVLVARPPASRRKPGTLWGWGSRHRYRYPTLPSCCLSNMQQAASAPAVLHCKVNLQQPPRAATQPARAWCIASQQLGCPEPTTCHALCSCPTCPPTCPDAARLTASSTRWGRRPPRPPRPGPGQQQQPAQQGSRRRQSVGPGATSCTAA